MWQNSERGKIVVNHVCCRLKSIGNTCKWIEKVNFPPCLCAMHHLVWPQVKRGNSTTTRSGKHLRISTSTTSAARGTRTDPPHCRTNGPCCEHCVDAAACFMSTEFELVRRFRGADGGTTWKPCIQKRSRRVPVTDTPQMERCGKGR